MPAVRPHLAQRGPSGRDGAVGQGGRRPAEDEGFPLEQVTDAARPDPGALRATGDDAAAAQRDGDQVRHPEVGPDATDLHSLGRLPREAVDQHADVGGRAADVDHERVGAAGEERRPADAVGRPAADGEHGVPQRMVEAHQGAVVLREEPGRLQVVRRERGPHRFGHVAGDPGQCPVEYGGVLPLQQADRADLVAERDVDLAEFALDDLGRQQFVARRDRGEHAGDDDALGGAADLAEKPGDGVGVQGRHVPAVELDAAFDDRRPDRDGVGEVTWPPEHRPDAEGGRAANPDHRHPPQVPALQHRVGRVGRAQHDVADPPRVCPWRVQDGVDRPGDPAGDVGRAGHLGLGDDPVGGIHDHRVGVGAADVDAEAVLRRGHGRAPPRAGNRIRSRTPAARPRRSRARFARPDRRRRRSPLPAGRT